MNKRQRDGVGLVQKNACANELPSQHRRRAGESSHRQHGIGWVIAKKFSALAKRRPKAGGEAGQVAAESDHRQRLDLHAVGRLDLRLVHLLLADKQRNLAAARHKRIPHGQTGK